MTKEELLKLCLLTYRAWADLKREMLAHFKGGTDAPVVEGVDLPDDFQLWLDLSKKVDTLRDTHKDKLALKRKELRLAAKPKRPKLTPEEVKSRKRDYMRTYMAKRRAAQRVERYG